MGRTKRDYMQQVILDIMAKNGFKINNDTLQQMIKAEEEWEEINKQQKLTFAARAWKYFHNLHTRK